MPKLPDVIGRFKVVDRIAQGGMGALYLAWDPTLERQIAIKLLRDDNDELRERFSREAKFVARLRHPRIVTVFDVGEHDGQPFIAMEYVQGNTLADIVRAETPLSVGVKLKWVEELCDGLGFAHRAGIVHRDVKPANMMVDAEGSIKILDFGIARDGPGRTQAGMLIGSLNYMSPEQVLGRPVDQRSDVFAVGGVLYELLTYRQAFSGGLDSGILAKILHDAPAPLLSIRPELDRDIARIVDRALEKDPANRYQEIQSMQRDLLRILRQFDASETRVDSSVTAVMLPPVPLRPTPPRTPRREPDRAALERRRAEQIQAHLETARAATSASDYKGAIAACEQALLLDSQHPMATELLEQANAALDARRAGEYLDEAQRQLEAGALTSASALVQQAFDLGETSFNAFLLRDAIEEAQAKREREQQRLEAGKKAVERACKLFEAGSFDEAVSAADEALTLLPADVTALSIKQRATVAAEEQRVERLNERARVTTAEARRLFAAGDHAGALNLLEGFDPRNHEDVVRTFDELETRLRTIERQVQEYLAEASAAVSARDLDGAAACVREALALAPAHERARAMDGAIREQVRQRELEERLERERQQAVAAKLEKAAQTTSHEGALVLITGALELDPQNEEARRSFESRSAALVNERARITAAEARRLFAAGAHAEALNLLDGFDPRDHGDIARTLDELRAMLRTIERQVQEYLADASAALSAIDLDRAAACVREALALDPRNERARAMDSAIREQARQRELEERLERERQQAVAAKLEKAAQTTSHEEALVLITGALELDPQNEEARRSFESRSAALVDERARITAAEARRLFAAGAHAEALNLLETFDPRNHEDVVRTFDELETRLRAIERQVQECLADASAALSATDLDRAAASVREALALKPADERARAMDEQISNALRERAIQRELEERLERERQQAVAAKLGKAAQATSHEEALVLINGALELDPQNEEARRSLEIRSAALEQQRAAERRRNQIDSACQRIEEMLAGDDLDAVEGALNAADDGADARKALAPLRRQLASKRLEITRRELAAVRQREREQAIAEALDRANRAVSHEVAVAAYRQILDLEPGHQLAQQGLSTRQAAQEKERLVAAALDRAAAAASDFEAVTALREVVELQPDLPDVLSQLQEREAALARQQEEARQKRHDDLIAGRVARVAAIPSHAAALVQLRKILDLDPANAEARRVLDLRELALKAEQEAQEQPHEVGADEKSASRADEEDETNPLEVIRPDERPHIPASSQGWLDRWVSFFATRGRRSYIIGAIAAAILLIVVAYGLNARKSVSPGAATAAPAPPQTSAPTPSPQIDPAPLKPESPPPVEPDPGPSPSPEAKDSPPDPVDPAVELENRLGPIRGLARRQVNQGNQREAVGTIMSGLKVQPDDAVLRRMLADMAQNAIAEASAARDSAMSAGFGLENLSSYREGRMKEQEGLRLAPRRPGAAVYALWDAASLYSQAAEEARRAKLQQPPPAVPPAPAPTTPPPTARKVETDPAVVRPPVVQPQAPAVSIAAEETAIRAVLRGYERGYGALSVSEIARVYPGIDAAALADKFKLMKALIVEILNPRISIVGSTAIVVCEVRERYTPLVGSRGQSTVKSTFRLGKRGDSWVIVERR